MDHRHLRCGFPGTALSLDLHQGGVSHRPRSGRRRPTLRKSLKSFRTLLRDAARTVVSGAYTGAMRANGLLMAFTALLTAPACSGPGEEATRTGEACVESDLIAQCPPGSNPLLGASAESRTWRSSPWIRTPERGAKISRGRASGGCATVSSRWTGRRACTPPTSTRARIWCCTGPNVRPAIRCRWVRRRRASPRPRPPTPRTWPATRAIRTWG